MIISRTPFRISFFGGGTDYPGWFGEHGGAVLATSIDKYCYITCRYLPPFFAYRSRVVYSKVESVQRNGDIEHPAARAVLKHLNISAGVEIHHDGDLPARTGLGSSSSFTVGLLHALHALNENICDKMALAREAIHIEQESLKENVGCQDQVMAALGGLQQVVFASNGAISASPLIINRKRLADFQGHLMLYFTGFSRIASEILEEQMRTMGRKKRELTRMREMVAEGTSLLTGKGKLADFGKLLDESWKLKKSLSSKVSTPVIDEIYEAAKKTGALGGKVLGAGGGGFVLLFAEPHRQKAIRRRLNKFLHVPFRFENEGSRIILYQPE